MVVVAKFAGGDFLAQPDFERSDMADNSIVAPVTDTNGSTGTSGALVDTLDDVPPTTTIASAANLPSKHECSCRKLDHGQLHGSVRSDIIYLRFGVPSGSP